MLLLLLWFCSILGSQGKSGIVTFAEFLFLLRFALGMEFKIYFSISVEKDIGILMKVTLIL
jgi:hypothetical protein